MSRKVSITSLLSVGFGLLLTIAVCTVLVIGVNATRNNTFRLMSQLSSMAVTNLHSQVRDFMQPVNDQLDYIAGLIEQGQLDPKDTQALNSVLNGSLSGLPQTLGIAYVDDLFQVQIIERSNNTVLTDNWKNNRRIEALFSSVNPINTSVWSDPIYTLSGNRLIPVMRMVYLPNGSKAMINTAINLQKLNEYLAQFDGEHTDYFMLLGRQKLLASSFPTPGLTFTEKHPLATLSQLKDQPLRLIWSPRAQENAMQLPLGQYTHNVEFGDSTWIYIYREIRDYAEVPITLGVVVSTETLNEERNTLFLQIIFSILLLLLFIYLSWRFSRNLGQRFSHIAQGFEAIKDSHLEQLETMPGSPVLEFDQVASAYNRMTEGLKQNEQMRNLFGQLVPPDIARQMLTQQGKLKPQQELATIFFIDLEGFTALSERLPAPELIETLNAFFSMVSEELETEGGIITQFQGDAVLAIFNIPNPQPDHAQRAVNAARRILTRIASERFNNHTLNCRIGINSGEVIAGNVGAPNRRNYTVHGDAVNLASRLESLNKEYGTRILISASTIQQLVNVESREIGTLAIRGKQQVVRVYTLAELTPLASDEHL